jgi:hypothetical protein
VQVRGEDEQDRAENQVEPPEEVRGEGLGRTVGGAGHE